MYYIIDANNLAGSLQLLGKIDFDQELIERFQSWGAGGRVNFVLVFDSLDTLGDSFTENNLRVIYSPCDEVCQSADDKIVEIFEQVMDKTNYQGKFYQQLRQNKIVLVSNDIDLQKRTQAVAPGIECWSNQDFLDKFSNHLVVADDGQRGLNEHQQKETEEYLLQMWKNRF